MSLVLSLIMVLSFAACGKDETSQSGTGEPVQDSTEIGDAAVSQSAQSYIEVSREGIVEQIPVEIIRGTTYDYTIAMDPEYFTFRTYEGVDTFSYEAWEGERAVYYTVYPIFDLTPQQAADGLVHQNSDNYADCLTEKVTLGEYEAVAVYLERENAAPDYQLHFFLIECAEGCIVIETQFTMEMYEGLYAIMRQCFNTFTMVETD